jgi:RNA polymerase sigma-70 factor (ECF subfamily)
VENEAVGYLYRTAFSVVMDHFRREKRAHFWDFAAPASRPMNPDLSTDVERAFDQLKMKDRTLLWLAYIEEMTHSEIAAIIKVKEGSVKVLLSRARNRMESSLKKHGVSAEEFA